MALQSAVKACAAEYAFSYVGWTKYYGMASWLCAACLLYVPPQYTMAYVINRPHSFPEEGIRKVGTVIREVASTDGRRLNVFGDYAVWFADPEHYTVASPLTQDKASLATLVVCFDMASDSWNWGCNQIGRLIQLVPVSTVDLHAAKAKVFMTKPIRTGER